MKKLTFILSLLMISQFYGQTSSKIDLATFKTSRDSLKKLILTLLTNKNKLKQEIDSLKKLSSYLDEKINLANREIEEVLIKKFGRENGKRIYNKQIWKGMTEKMLLISWGKPDKIDKNVEKWGTFTQWYYGKITFFFRDGKLIDFEESK